MVDSWSEFTEVKDEWSEFTPVIEKAPLGAGGSWEPTYGAAEQVGFGPGLPTEIDLAAQRAVSSLDQAEEKKDSFLSRVGKGLYNAVIAQPAYTFKTQTEIGKIGKEVEGLAALSDDFPRRVFAGEPVTQQEIEWYASPTIRGKPVKRPFWAETVWLNYQNNRLNVVDSIDPEVTKKALQKADISWSEKSDISLSISEAQGLKDKAADVVAGVVGFGTRLALLKKAFPSAPPVLLWEIENEASGGTPGKGALTYGLFNAPGKVLSSKAGQLAAESTLLGGMAAIESKLETGEISWEDVTIGAGIPWALRSQEFILKGIRAKKPKIVAATKKIASLPSPSPTIEGATTNLREWAKTAQVVPLAERKAALKKLHAQQQAGGQNLKEEYKKAHPNATAEEVNRAVKLGMAGKAKAGEIEPPQLTPKQWNSIAEKIQQVYGKDSFKTTNTQDALDNLRFRRKLPAPHEFGLLEPILGTETTVELYSNLSAKRPLSRWDKLKMVRDGLKSKFGYDPQAARQFAAIGARHPIIKSQALWSNLKGMFLSKSVDQITKRTIDDPQFKSAQERGINFLGMKPWELKGTKRLQQYGDFSQWLSQRKNPLLKTWGRVLLRVEKASNAAINQGLLAQYKVADRHISKLAEHQIKKGKPLSSNQIEAFWKSRVNNINTFSKRIVAKHPTAKSIQEAANWVLFSPSYTIARPKGTWDAITALFKGPVGNRTYGAQVVVSNIASITAWSSVAAWAGTKLFLSNPDKPPRVQGSIDPTNSLWGKVRIGNDVIDFTRGEGTWYRLLDRLGVSAYAYARSQLGDKMVTKVGDSPVRNAGEEMKRYLESRETILLGLTKTIATGKDWLGRDVGPTDVLLQNIPMEPLQAIVDAGVADGLWEHLYEGDYSQVGMDLVRNFPISALGTMGYGVSSYPIPAINTRANYREVLSEETYNKSWDQLTPIEQSRLERKNKDTFKRLDKQIAVERIDKPVNVDRIKEEEKEAGERVRRRLTPANQTKLQGTSIGLSRYPGDFYLNDNRYNRYIELTAEELNTLLDKFKKSKDEVIPKIESIAKKKALIRLQKEIK